jgi:putative membrane protein
MRWMWVGLGAMFVLIGIAAVIGVLYPGSSTVTTTPYPNYFGWVWGLVGLFFSILFIVWIFGGIFGVGWGFWGGRRYRYRRWGYGDEYSILRERYAKGEITKDQFDQMMRDLQQSEH